jgi:uncharacterized protein with HEPN domain
VVRNFEIIGEAASRLSPAIRDANDVPWTKVIAFRNRLIHGYWSIGLQLVWFVIEHELPMLKAAVGPRRHLAAARPRVLHRPPPHISALPARS